MIKKIIPLLICLTMSIGCVMAVDRQTQEILYQDGKLQKFAYYSEQYGKHDDSSSFMEAIDIIRRADPMALPEFGDLPMPSAKSDKYERVKKYVGIIKNDTKYDINIPSLNSQGTITIPARGWVEYVVWSPTFKFTAYKDGKPYSCFNITVNPGEFPFMCSRYDFMAVIGEAEPTAVEGLG